MLVRGEAKAVVTSDRDVLAMVDPCSVASGDIGPGDEEKGVLREMSRLITSTRLKCKFKHLR